MIYDLPKRFKYDKASKRGPDDSPKLPIVSAEAGLLWSQCTEFERDNYQSAVLAFGDDQTICWPKWSKHPNVNTA
ncbi:7728_t:CDS:2, partial [Entrophospora sp. SA101]